MPKKPKIVDRPFPWKCRQCGQRSVVLAQIEYEAAVRHDGRLHKFVVPNLEKTSAGSDRDSCKQVAVRKILI